MYGSKAKRATVGCFSLATNVQQLPSKQLVCGPVAWEDKCPEFYTLLSAPDAEHHAIWYGKIILVSFVTCPTCPTSALSHPLTHSQLNDASMLCKHSFSNSQNTGVLPTLVSYQCKAQQHMGYRKKNQLHPNYVPKAACSSNPLDVSYQFHASHEVYMIIRPN